MQKNAEFIRVMRICCIRLMNSSANDSVSRSAVAKKMTEERGENSAMDV